MKNVIVFVCSLFSGIVFADVPHITPALGCLANQTCCPTSITCNYLSGCGDTGTWVVSSEQVGYFEQTLLFQLYGIAATRTANSNSYSLECYYMGDISRMGTPGTISLSSSGNNSLNGDYWSYSFMKKYAMCNEPNNSLACTGTPG